MSDSRKKILIVSGIYPPEIGGPASYGQALARKLAQDHRVTVISYSTVFSSAADRAENFKIIRVWKKNISVFRYALYFLKLLFLVPKADVVYALNAASAGLPGIILARFFNKKFFVKIVGDKAWETSIQKGETSFLLNDFQGSKKSFGIGLLHRVQSYVCRSANGVIVPSQYLAEIVKGWSVSEDKISVVYNGTDFKALDIAKEEARKKIGIHGNIIISIGRLVPWKGFRMLIKIMPQLLEINQFFRLVIVGSGPDMGALRAMISNLGLDRKVFVVGSKSHEELRTYLAASEIFILNSGYEGFSHQILEAMAAGVPVIASAIGGNKEVIHQGENGFLIRYNDEFNLIEAIKTLWQMPDLRKSFVESGKSDASEFTIDKMFQETAKILFNE
jgi:glycosyltransferase involved in cell wall biosynthesis